MGNRAVITASKSKDIQNSTDIGVYMHWNGGRESVEAFLTYCKAKGYPAPNQDNFGWARLCQVVCNFFGGGLSVGVDKCCRLDCDNYDNGVYVIRGWDIVDRVYAHDSDDDFSNEYYNGVLQQVNASMPESEQLSEAQMAILYKEVPVE